MRFRPPWWAWTATLPLLALLCGLGTWQLRRGAEKAALAGSYAAGQAQQPQELGAEIPAATRRPVRVRATGRYDGARQLLLDNQSHEGKPGYHVWTPLLLTSGATIVVDRGWLPLGEARERLVSLAAPAGDVAVTGLWRSLPEPGMRLTGSDDCPSPPSFPVLVNYPSHAELACLLGEEIGHGVLLLDAADGGGYVRDWSRQILSIPPSRHYGYALQWYALAALLGFLFVRFNLKRS